MKKLMIIVSIINLCGVLENAMGQQDIRLILRLDRDGFLESQAVWANVALVNYTATTQTFEPYVLSDDMTRGIRFRLIDEKGISVPKSGAEGIYDDFGRAKPRVLVPGDSITRMFDILGWFSTSRIGNSTPYLRTLHYLKAGSYTLQALQFTGKDTLYSNKARFIVEKPTGKELRVLQFLTDADRKYAKDPRSDSTTLAYEGIVTFHQSVYAPYAYYRLIFIHHSLRSKQNNQKVFILIARMAKAFPNDAQSLDVVSTYTPIILREGRQDILEALARDLPETKVGKLSKQKLHEKGRLE